MEAMESRIAALEAAKTQLSEENQRLAPQPTRPPPWAKLALGLGFVLTALWNGVILWGIIELVKVTL
jgi:hypothetical protein